MEVLLSHEKLLDDTPGPQGVMAGKGISLSPEMFGDILCRCQMISLEEV